MNSSDRLMSLDVFRGLTMAAMILVNTPGSWAHTYPWVIHAEWGEPLTPTDFIFPFFLFIVGVAIPLALWRRRQQGADQRALLLKIFRRGAVLFCIGILLALVPRFDLGTVRIPGVLQRIAVVYVACSLVLLKTSWQVQIGLAAGVLVAYWLLLTLIPVPGYSAANLQPDTNLAAWMDQRLLGKHMLYEFRDPEGILSTLPAVVTGILGLLAGQWLMSSSEPASKVRWMMLAGGLICIVGLVWGFIFPAIKDIWTSSYVLITGGVALIFLALCYWVVDALKIRWGITPLVAYGVNCLAVFVAANLLVKMLIYLIRIPVEGGQTVSAYSWIYRNWFASWLEPEAASLLFAVGMVIFWLAPLWILYKRRLFIRI